MRNNIIRSLLIVISFLGLLLFMKPALTWINYYVGYPAGILHSGSYYGGAYHGGYYDQGGAYHYNQWDNPNMAWGTTAPPPVYPVHYNYYQQHYNQPNTSQCTTYMTQSGAVVQNCILYQR